MTETYKNKDISLKELHGFLSEHSREKSIVLSPRLYAAPKEKIFLQFLPLRPIDGEPKWEDWNCYRSTLRLYLDDFQKLLIPYFDLLFPLSDPITGEKQNSFDPCFDN